MVMAVVIIALLISATTADRGSIDAEESMGHIASATSARAPSQTISGGTTLLPSALEVSTVTTTTTTKATAKVTTRTTTSIKAPVVTTVPTVVTTTVTTAAPRWYVRVYNADDTGTAYVNGSAVVSVGYAGDSGWRDVTGYFHAGSNTVRFTMWNDIQGYTWGFGVKKNGTVVWSAAAGQAGVSGANGGDSSRTNQMVYDRTISVE
jgi:hypothetical protein